MKQDRKLEIKYPVERLERH